MRTLLAAIESKYIHIGLAVHSLRAYAEKEYPGKIDIASYTINEDRGRILADIYERQPELLMFSCYIWNISTVRTLAAECHKVLPKTVIWAGGPEVSFRSGEFLKDNPAFTGVMAGEGEKTFLELLNAYEASFDEPNLRIVRGIFCRDAEAAALRQESLELDELLFPMAELEYDEKRIVYYESSRGCPFSCSYCLSSVEKALRVKSLCTVYRELQVFLDRRAKQVKFVDRTFNCDHGRAMAIWQYILEHDNGITNFHFEIAADLLRDDQISLMRKMRPGLIQLEAGVQSTNDTTLSAIRRHTDIGKVREMTLAIHSLGSINQHLDLIAGLPYEDYDSFRKSFNDVYEMKPEQLQLGFLKVLKGSPIELEAPEYGIVCRDDPPYEVLSTKWLSYRDICRLKQIEELVEVYYNSGQFGKTLEAAQELFADPFTMYESLAVYYKEQGLYGPEHSRQDKYAILLAFLEVLPEAASCAVLLRETLAYDYYARENVRSRPDFVFPDTITSGWRHGFFEKEAHEPSVLEGYEGLSKGELARRVHIERFTSGFLPEGPGIYVFDYKKRDPVTGNAASFRLPDILEGEM